MQGNNNGQSISGLDKSYTNLITGSILSVPDGKGNICLLYTSRCV